MTIYSYPGVYVQETPTSAHPIEGVSTHGGISYPGVYLEEQPASVHPIDGVATSTHSAATTRSVPAHTPDWTNLNAGDPGRTLLELFAFLGESLVYRADLVPERHSRLTDGARASSESAVMRFHKP